MKLSQVNSSYGFPHKFSQLKLSVSALISQRFGRLWRNYSHTITRAGFRRKVPREVQQSRSLPRKALLLRRCRVSGLSLLSRRTGESSLLQQRLSPVEAVVWPVREGEDGRVHELPHAGVALLLAGAEAQVWNLRPNQRESKGSSAKIEPKRTSALWRRPRATWEVMTEPTFRTIWMKSLGVSGLRPCSWRVQASKEDAWATISTLFPTRGRKPRQDVISAADKQ